MSDPMMAVRMDPTLRTIVEASAAREGVTLSGFVRRALADAAVKTIRACGGQGEDEVKEPGT